MLHFYFRVLLCMKNQEYRRSLIQKNVCIFDFGKINIVTNIPNIVKKSCFRWHQDFFYLHETLSIAVYSKIERIYAGPQRFLIPKML